MSCTASAACCRPVLSLCCTEPSPSCGAVLSGRITTVVMSRSGQLGQRRTMGKHCSGLHVCRHLNNARVCLRKHVSLAACLGQLSLSLFRWSTTRRGLWDTRQHQSSPLKKIDPRAVGHVAASELTSTRM
jgi:hypothetical protein